MCFGKCWNGVGGGFGKLWMTLEVWRTPRTLEDLAPVLSEPAVHKADEITGRWRCYIPIFLNLKFMEKWKFYVVEVLKKMSGLVGHDYRGMGLCVTTIS